MGDKKTYLLLVHYQLLESCYHVWSDFIILLFCWKILCFLFQLHFQLFIAVFCFISISILNCFYFDVRLQKINNTNKLMDTKSSIQIN
ncbi:hypothetical protein QVD17_36475 [Tagetes erecta]|uniref:Uncharacterized protein n=1 Tax=Tagetes erecta TaxID=13708 RepID=A0AAD8JSI2_TARER|nr:hypothetical protein QVD17_36475 [Tagetes erecta]